MRHSGLGHVEIAIEIGLDGAVEMLVGQLLEAVDVLLKGGVVDEDVELAELVDGLSTASLQNSGSATSPENKMQRRPSFSTARLVSSASSCSSR